MLKRKKSKIIIPIFLIIIAALIIYLLKTTAEKNFAGGNYQLSSGKYTQALKSYETAGTMWPFLKSNIEYQKKLQITQDTLEEIKNRPAVTIFLKEKVTEREIQQLADEIKNIEKVKEVKVISKAEALKQYKEQNKNDPALLDLVTADILPASIEIYTDDIPSKEEQERIAALSKSKPFVEHVVTSSNNF